MDGHSAAECLLKNKISVYIQTFMCESVMK